MFLYYSLVSLSSVIISLLMVLVTVSNDLINRKEKVYICLTFIAIGIATICEYSGMYVEYYKPNLILLHRVVKTMELVLVPFIPYFFTLVINKIKWLRNTFLIVLIAHGVFQIASACWLNLVFVISSKNIYTHGKFYFIYITTYILSILTATIVAVPLAKKYQYKKMLLFFIPLLYIIFSLIIQMAFGNIKLYFLNAVISAIVFYISYQNLMYSLEPMTGLLNRQSYSTKINNMNSNCTIINLDLNKFKYINDTYGHSKGDEYLIKFAQLLKKTYSKYGDCYRTGGDEFCVIITRDIDCLDELAKNLENSVKKAQKSDPIMPGFSIGSAKFILDKSESILEAIDLADQNMYQDKEYKKSLINKQN